MLLTFRCWYIHVAHLLSQICQFTVTYVLVVYYFLHLVLCIQHLQLCLFKPCDYVLKMIRHSLSLMMTHFLSCTLATQIYKMWLGIWYTGGSRQSWFQQMPRKHCMLVQRSLVQFSNFQNFFQTFWDFGSRRKSIFFSLPLVNLTAEKYTVWQILLMKKWLVVVTLINITQ